MTTNEITIPKESLMDVDFNLMVEAKKAVNDATIFRNFGKIIKDQSWSADTSTYSATFKDNSTVSVKRKLEGFNIDFSNPERYLSDDDSSTLMGIDRLMYYIDVTSSEVSLYI